MTNIKTVILSGTEVKVEGLAGQNTIIQNLGGSAVYARDSPGIEAGADGVLEIPAGGAANLYGTNGTVYLIGHGKVQLTGTDYADINCVSAAAGASGGGSSGGSDNGYVITKEEIDSLFDKAPSGGSSGGFVITKEEIDKLFK